MINNRYIFDVQTTVISIIMQSIFFEINSQSFALLDLLNIYTLNFFFHFMAQKLHSK